MPSATMTSKGQITIPVEVRTQLGIDTGDRVEFIRNEETGRYEIIPATVPVQALKGIVPKPKKPVSIADMNEAIRKRGMYSR
ncbi:MAG TPA: AbrB/MazE/SpoVT family DNA-binding domain-containing protein [Silvibacterium sp.]|nr:AbrB/MazE/SpoVT family DNA-binding domain-containing protein [Silvibacterium sp.]